MQNQDMSGTNMSKESITIFDISLLVDSICSSLGSHDIVKCRRVCKQWNAAFAANEWRSVWLLKKGTTRRYTPLPAMATGLIRDNAQWIRSLGVSLFDSTLQGSACTNLQRLVCEYNGGPHSEPNMEDTSSLALLWQNRGLNALEFDFYESHVRRHVVPNLRRLTNLQHLNLTLNYALLSDVSLLLDTLQCLPPSLLELIVQANSTRGWRAFSDEVIAPSSTWGPSAIRRLIVRGANSGDHFFIPFLRACPHLQSLELPAVSTKHAKELMGTLATSCPHLSWLKLSSDRTPTAPWPSECLYFPQMQQTFTVLSLSIYHDIDNRVVPTVLAHSAATLRELCLENAIWLTRKDVPKILCSCPELRILRVSAFYDPAGQPIASTPLQDLVETPWVCTRLQELHLAVTDAKEPSLDLEKDEEVEGVERQKLARLVLRLHYQLQALEDFSPFCSLQFFGPTFIMMPLETGLRHMGWQMTEDDLHRLGLWWQSTEHTSE